MKAERKLFEDLIASATSGWDVEISPSLDLGGVGLAAFSTRFYLVDTQHGWAFAASVKPDVFGDAATLVRAGKLSIKDATNNLGGAILGLGEQSLCPSKPDQSLLEAATMACAVYLLGTSTFEQAKVFNGEGHWIVLAYKMRDGTSILRPVFFKDDSLSYLSYTDLKGLVRQVTALDLSGPGTNVGRMIQACGGAVLSSSDFAP